MLTSLCNVDPLTPHFYIVKLGFTGVYVFSSPEPKAQGELINSIRVEPSSVCVSGCVSVDIFKLEYLRNQGANRNEILTEPSLGWGKGCIRFWV